MKKIRRLDPMVVIKNAQLKAVESMLMDTTEFFERKVRRWFSKTYSTAYMDTFNIPWEEILLHYYEAGIESLEYNEVFDLAIRDYLPEFMNQAEQEDQEFADSLVKEQEETLAKKKAKEATTTSLETEASRLASNAVIVKEKAQSINEVLDKRRTTLPKPKAMSLKFDDEGDPENF